ncbi:MAG: hypothetical protein IT462_02265 [Planctomycetes bacterium]|nr:hypothetical protein [Planctomycetota bacterium]
MPTDLKFITAKNAPAAIGPYSHAVIANGFVFCSGQIPLDPAGNIVSRAAADQTTQVMKNIAAILEASGSAMSKIVKCTIFLKNLGDWGVVNDAYAKALGEHRPARATVEVARLPKEVLVEIDCVAVV